MCRIVTGSERGLSSATAGATPVRALLGTILVLAATLVACGGEEGTDSSAVPERRALLPEPPGEVVARVDGEPITRAQVEAALARAPEGTSPEEALASLIQLHVVSEKARAHELDALPEARVARHRALVQRLLEEQVESVTAEQIDDAAIREAYDRFAVDFFEPELVTASPLVEQARALATEIEAALRALDRTPTADDMDRIGRLANLRGMLTVQVDHDLTFPRRPIPTTGHEKPRYQAVVEPFADAAFALDADDPISPPVLSPFGVHVVVFRERTDGERPPLDEVREEIRQALLERARVQTIEALMRQLRTSARIEVDEAAIQEQGARQSGIGTPDRR